MKDEDAIVMGGLAILLLSKKKPTEAVSQPIVPQPPVPIPQPQPTAPQPTVTAPHPGFAPCCPNTAQQLSVPPSLQQYFTVQQPTNKLQQYQSSGIKATIQVKDSSGQYVYVNEFDTGFWLNEGEGKTLIINAPRVVKVVITPKSTSAENYKTPTLFVNGHIVEFPSMFQTFLDGKQINNGNYVTFYDTSSLVIQSRAGKFNLLVQIYVAPDTVKCSENDMGSIINVNCG
jgi:hypothetical protein